MIQQYRTVPGGMTKVNTKAHFLLGGGGGGVEKIRKNSNRIEKFSFINFKHVHLVVFS
jgi:hypothetical protein